MSNELINVLNILDNFATGGGGSGNDPRFKFEVGDSVRVKNMRPEQIKQWGADHAGTAFTILNRRNGYPPPYFVCWFPLYYLDGIGEMGESMLEPNS